jgi:hypothetical protein
MEIEQQVRVKLALTVNYQRFFLSLKVRYLGPVLISGPMTQYIIVAHYSSLTPNPIINPQSYCLLNFYDLIDVLLVYFGPVRSQHSIESFSTWMHPLHSLTHF